MMRLVNRGLLSVSIALGTISSACAETILDISRTPSYPIPGKESKDGPLAKIEGDGTFFRAVDPRHPGTMQQGRLSDRDVRELKRRFSNAWAAEFAISCLHLVDSAKYAITVSINGKTREFECEVQDSGPVGNLIDLIWKLQMIE